jgi:hypothetical protein
MSGNWQFMQPFRVKRNGRLFMDRLKVLKTPWFGIYLHCIHGPDVDPDPHDHPWFFVSVALTGGYEERVWDYPASIGSYSAVGAATFARTRTHSRFRPMLMRRSQAHEITKVDGYLWTLVFVGPDHEDWRFWTRSGPVPWQEYLKAGGYTPDELKAQGAGLP